MLTMSNKDVKIGDKGYAKEILWKIRRAYYKYFSK